MQKTFHTLDLLAADLLPTHWLEDVRALADSPAKQVLLNGQPDGGGDLTGLFACVDGSAIRSALPWMWKLYHNDLRTFAAHSLGYTLFSGNRLRATMTLNILAGEGAANGWHTDMNTVTGVVYAVVPDTGGELVLRDKTGGKTGGEATLKPLPGLFVCFEGATEHQVTPLAAGELRLAIAMVYYRSETEQPRAYDVDLYQLSDM